MRHVLHSLLRAALRIYPRCVTQSQAVAFNMFLAFFPFLLFALGIFTSWGSYRAAVHELGVRLRDVLPPGSEALIVEFLARRTTNPWNIIFLGLGGTLLAGSQAMKLLMTGFHMVHNEPERGGYWRRQGSALLLLCLTIGPFLASVVLTVFGKQLRNWFIHEFGMRTFIGVVWSLAFPAAALLLAMLVLALFYHLGRPLARGWKEVLPGAILATLLWWAVNAAFGFYVRHMPYSAVYGGLGAAIGLLIWMQLTAMIIFLGTAFNAEYSQGK